MVTNISHIVCPKCKSVDCYEILKSTYIDNDLHVKYCCEACGSEYTDVYTLVYLGGYLNNQQYDRDNLISG